jgi:hypothetical protein
VTRAEPARLSPALSFLPKQIREPGRAWQAILVGWLTTTIPSLLLAYLVSLLFPALDQPEFAMPPVVALVAIVLISPLLETLIMAAILSLLLRFVPAMVAILLSAAGWAVVHSLQASAWGLVIWWPFLIFSTLFVTWRPRSLPLAFAIPMCVHALQNLLPALLVAYGAAR